MRLAGKVAIVTGGSGGLGGATARRFAHEGAKVVITDINADAGKAMAEEVGARFVPHDVASEADWQAVLDAATGYNGRIDILVNSAGIEGDFERSGLDTTLAEWRRVMAVNLDGTFLGCRMVVPLMQKAGTGSIVNIASAVSIMGTPTGMAYGASKAGVEQLTRSVAMIGARDGKRIRCNSIHPGVIRTRMTDSIIAEFAKAQSVSEEESEAAINGAVPFGRRGEPDDIANMALFLASDESSYVTGGAFRVDGGWSVISAG